MTVRTAGWCAVKLIGYNGEHGPLEMSEGGPP